MKLSLEASMDQVFQIYNLFFGRLTETKEDALIRKYLILICQFLSEGYRELYWINELEDALKHQKVA